MMARWLVTLATAALLLTGCTALGGRAPRGGEDVAARQVEAQATAARRALADRHWTRAVAHAESAVDQRRNDPALRALLGTAYLRAGRFVSAEQAFGDALALHDGDGRSALHLALSQIAQGKGDAAVAVLERHAGAIPVADRGLALALAGRAQAGVEVLMAAMRVPGADARTRQNLALALALAGDWRDAHMIVGLDLDPAATNRRMLQWMQFAQPRNPADQVAALLHIVPAVDPGQPVALALTIAPAASSVADAVDRYMPGPPVEQAAIAAIAAVVAPSPAAPSPTVPSRTAPPPAAPRAPAAGRWFVQLGAYDNAAVARDGWARARRRVPALAGRAPFAIPAAPGRSRFYRLSVGGFALPDAIGLCRQLKARGSRCYVRAAEGDRVAAWHRAAGVRFAAR